MFPEAILWWIVIALVVSLILGRWIQIHQGPDND